MTRPNYRQTIAAKEHRRPATRHHHRPSTTSRAPHAASPTTVSSADSALVQYYATDSTAPHLRAVPAGHDGRGARVRRRKRWGRCPNKPTGMVVNRRTGLIVDPQCRRLRCPVCIVPRAVEVGQALALAQPNLAILLTEVGATWPEVQQGMKMFKQRLRRIGAVGQFAYNLEPSRGGANSHAHLWWRGEEVDHAAIELAATSGRFGHVVDVVPAYSLLSETSGRPYIDYGFKAILRNRPDAPAALWPSAEDYLDRNGGRLMHNTIDFWIDAAGRRTTQREAVRAARGTSAGDWIFMGDAA